MKEKLIKYYNQKYFYIIFTIFYGMKQSEAPENTHDSTQGDARR